MPGDFVEKISPQCFKFFGYAVTLTELYLGILVELEQVLWAFWKNCSSYALYRAVQLAPDALFV